MQLILLAHEIKDFVNCMFVVGYIHLQLGISHSYIHVGLK
jgi:hypothetical protein